MAPRNGLDDRWVELVRSVQTEAPLRPDLLGWRPEQIVLTKGCDARPHEAIFCERLLAAFPDAGVVDRRDVPHNRISVPGSGTLERLRLGKSTLVLGAIRSSVSRNCDPESSAGTLCAPYHSVHPSWFCFYDCAYCYLSGSPGVRFSPTVRLFTNLQDVLAGMQGVLKRSDRPVSFYVGKVQDGLQLDPVGNFSRVLVPFCLAHPDAHLVFLTKSTAIDGVRESWREQSWHDGGKVVVSWSLNPAEISKRFEEGAPSLQERLMAAAKCSDTGMEVRFVFMPLLPVEGWRELYEEAVSQAFAAVRPSRVTIGGICSYPGALSDTRKRLGDDNGLIRHATTRHGRRLRYDLELRGQLYGHLIDCVRSCGPGTPVSLCLESTEGWEVSSLDFGACRCNCITMEYNFRTHSMDQGR